MDVRKTAVGVLRTRWRKPHRRFAPQRFSLGTFVSRCGAIKLADR